MARRIDTVPQTKILFRIRRLTLVDQWRIYYNLRIYTTRLFPTKKAAADYLVALGHFDELQGSVRAMYHNPVPNKATHEPAKISESDGWYPTL